MVSKLDEVVCGSIHSDGCYVYIGHTLLNSGRGMRDGWYAEAVRQRFRKGVWNQNMSFDTQIVWTHEGMHKIAGGGWLPDSHASMPASRRHAFCAYFECLAMQSER